MTVTLQTIKAASAPELGAGGGPDLRRMVAGIIYDVRAVVDVAEGLGSRHWRTTGDAAGTDEIVVAAIAADAGEVWLSAADLVSSKVASFSDRCH